MLWRTIPGHKEFLAICLSTFSRKKLETARPFFVYNIYPNEYSFKKQKQKHPRDTYSRAFFARY